MKLGFLVLSFVFLLMLLSNTKAFVGFGSVTNGNWFNVSWNYRVRIEVNSTLNMTNWPIEHRINFTDLLPSGEFDINSTRVFEHDSQGRIIREMPFQFELDSSYNSSSNAAGTIVFLMNGTTVAGNKRIFYV